MTTRRSRRTTLGVSLTTALGVVVSTGVSIGWGTDSASAAFPGLPHETQFEIDGNTAVGSGQDWYSDPVAAPNLQDEPWITTEVCNNNPVLVEDPDNPGQFIEVTNELTRLPQGSKLDDLDLGAIPPDSGNVPRKTDLCQVFRTWELVFVPDAGSPDPTAGQYHFIFYGGWNRPNVNGEIDVLFPLLGSDDTSKDDDLVISYDFVDSTNLTKVEVLDWDGDSWEPITLPANAFEAVTTRGVETLPSNPDQALTFGEFAINLTLAGVLPENGPCVSLTAGDPMSRTGNSANASMEDIVDASPIVLTNCGSLTITKETAPATPASLQTFTVETSELDGAPIQTGAVTLLTDDLLVPDDPTVTHLDMLISPDYQVVETDLPAGWSELSVVCESYDPIAGVGVTRTLYSSEAGPDSSFPIAPGVEATCTVTNIGPPTVTVNKVTVGGAGGDFTVVVDDGEATQISGSTTEAGTPTLLGGTEVAVGSVSIGETAWPDAWTPDGMSCVVTDATGQTAEFTADGSDPVVVDLAGGDVAECTQTNLAPGSVQVTKSVDGTSTDWAFEFTISPVPAGETATKTATAGSATVGWDGLIPGTDYTITEADVDGYISGDVDCGDGPTFSAAPGITSTCTVTNTELGAVDVTKSVDGTSTDWAFEFTISPVPAGETATKTATAGSATVGWDGLIPGTDYTITEADVDGYISGDVDCGDGPTFSAAPGITSTCTVTNTELGAVDVTKSVDGTSTDWAFEFTISPVPAGETATKTATAGSATVGWDGLIPGTDYTITEADVDGYISGDVDCGDGPTFSAAPGITSTCTVTNTELAEVAVTKTVVPVETGWSYDFTISPVPAGETATKSATAAAPAVSWDGLIPGTEYTVTELEGSDLVTGTLTCTDGTNAPGTSRFTPGAGDAVTCTITNTRIADIQVVKTAGATSVLPGGPLPWTIQVTNNGPSTALDVVLTDTLPAQLTLVSVAASAGWDCSASVTGNPGTVSCSKPDMLPGETWAFTVNTTVTGVTGGETITNVAVVTTTTDETTTDNNTDSASSAVEVVRILPPTGGYVQTRLMIGGLLIAAGLAMLLLEQRRRPTI